jgi:hypothetical protein
MQLRGIVRSATLEENPPGSDQIELILGVQGVGPGQPRILVVPYALLLEDTSLDPDQVLGKAFQAEAMQDTNGRWIVTAIAVAENRILRDPET